MEYSRELESKRERVSELLGVQDIACFSANESHYRARAEFRIWHSGEVVNYAMGRLDKKGIIPVEECPKVIKPIEERFKPLLKALNSSKILKNRLFAVEFLASTVGECLITLIYHRKLDEVWIEEAQRLEKLLNCSIIGRSRKQKLTLSREFVTEKLQIFEREYIYHHYEGGFTQPNPFINTKMIEWAISQAQTVGRGDLLEAYCGLGNFTIPLSNHFNRVLATEISKRSIASAKENCRLNGVTNIEFVRLSSEEMTQALQGVREFRRLRDIDLKGYNFSTVLVDPPRAGLDSSTIELIGEIENIIYISCNPETLARDLNTLSKTHKIVKSAMFDQFPHTPHIESGVFLKLME